MALYGELWGRENKTCDVSNRIRDKLKGKRCTHLQPQKFGVDLWIEPLKVGIGRYDSPFQHEHSLDYPCQATRSFEMADVGLDSPPDETIRPG
jgi:hypothetical protein